MNQKTILFILPSPSSAPIGGYKVIFEYANMFSKNSYDVGILYVYDNDKEDFLRKIFHFFKFIVFKSFSSKKWFALNGKIKEFLFVKQKKRHLDKFITNYDILCASSVSTAYFIADEPFFSTKRKFYLIQDYEKWGQTTDEYLLNSYKLDLEKIVISPWLKEKVSSVGEKAVLIENGFDFNYFKLTNPINKRFSFEVSMLYHLDDRKRCEDSFKALEIVKKEIPELHVNIFGVFEKPKYLPDWYTYYRKPNKAVHNMILNNSAIFIAASKAEGMALPPAEAMICGCALCCTDIGGFNVYAKNNETALTSPVFEYEKLAENIKKLILDKHLREKIAISGNKFIQHFTWESAFEKFRNLVEKS